MQDNHFSFYKECVLLVCSLAGCMCGDMGGVSPPITDRVISVQKKISAFIETKENTSVQPTRKKAW